MRHDSPLFVLGLLLLFSSCGSLEGPVDTVTGSAGDVCLKNPAPTEDDLVETTGDAQKFYYALNFEDLDLDRMYGEVDFSFCYSGGASVKSTSVLGKAGGVGGHVPMPRNLSEGDEVWIRFRVFFPLGYEFNSCIRKGLIGCVIFT